MTESLQGWPKIGIIFVRLIPLSNNRFSELSHCHYQEKIFVIILSLMIPITPQVFLGHPVCQKALKHDSVKFLCNNTERQYFYPKGACE